MAIDLLIVFLAVIYIALVYWTFADARRRIEDPLLIGCATAAALFPFVGPVVYMILRPPEYLEDVRERELEMQAAEARLGEADYGLCPHCDYRVERDFLRCPSCLRKLKERCASCARPLEQSWTICPYCEAEVAAGVAPSRSTRRRRSSTGTPEEPPAERPGTSSRRRRRATETQALPAEETLALERASLSNGLDTALDVDLLGETVESDQLALADQDGSDAAPVPGSSRVPPAPARPRRRSQRPTS
ncbi:MAG: zinc ribbon domain-containing protein [Solirubrobacteraceae bacterium]